MDNIASKETVILRDFCMSGPIGRTVYCYDTVDSTNLVAKRNCKLSDGTVFVAEKQTCGRGRLGRHWISCDGGLWFSILLKPQLNAELISQLTLVFGLAVCRSIPGTMIKWPNDIVLNRKKLCGILTEMSYDSDGNPYVVCGIGINVNNREFESEIKDIATSIVCETGKEIEKKNLLNKICEAAGEVYSDFLNHGFESLLNEYKSKCITLGKEVIVKNNDGELPAFAYDIDEAGELIVIIDGKKIKVMSGEVSVRGLFGYI